MVGWLQPDGIHIDLAFRYTLEHLRAPKTPWNIPPKTTPDAPLHSQRWIRHKRTPTDTLRQSWGMSEGCLGVFEDAWQVQSMRNLVWLEPTHHFGTTLKWGIFFTWRLQDIKISKPPYVPVPKMVQLCHFLSFLDLSERNYDWQFLLITLYHHHSGGGRLVVVAPPPPPQHHPTTITLYHHRHHQIQLCCDFRCFVAKLVFSSRFTHF